MYKSDKSRLHIYGSHSECV